MGALYEEMKMTRIIITKEQVINAILTEPLKAGNWVHDELAESYKEEQTCPVCAVGAVLRQRLKNNSPWRIRENAPDIDQGVTGDSYDSPLHRSHLVNLSRVFEYAYEDLRLRGIKLKTFMLHHIEADMPDKFTIEVD